MLSRVIGGLSEGNVQLAMYVSAVVIFVQLNNIQRSAILSDITTPANRSKALAHVGISFAICFCIGPPIGAYFASRPLPSSMKALGLELNVYAVPAILTLVLLSLETVFLIVALPETRGRPVRIPQEEKAKVSAPNGKTLSRKESVERRIGLLASLRNLHFAFLGIFSGVEFTLTFLTFDRTYALLSLKSCELIPSTSV